MNLQELEDIRYDLKVNLEECEESEIELTRFLCTLIECVDLSIRTLKGSDT